MTIKILIKTGQMRGLFLNILRFCLIPSFLFVAIGCSSKEQENYVRPTVIGGKTMQEHFALAARQVGDAWQRLAQLRAPTLSELGVNPNIKYSKAERLRITIVWHGPVEPVVRKIARIMGYRYKTFGDPAENNPIVSIKARRKMAVDILRNISDQLNPVGGIIIRNDKRTVELYYQVDMVNDTQYRKNAFGDSPTR